MRFLILALLPLLGYASEPSTQPVQNPVINSEVRFKTVCHMVKKKNQCKKIKVRKKFEGTKIPKK